MPGHKAVAGPGSGCIEEREREREREGQRERERCVCVYIYIYVHRVLSCAPDKPSVFLEPTMVNWNLSRSEMGSADEVRVGFHSGQGLGRKGPRPRRWKVWGSPCSRSRRVRRGVSWVSLCASERNLKPNTSNAPAWNRNFLISLAIPSHTSAKAGEPEGWLTAEAWIKGWDTIRLAQLFIGLSDLVGFPWVLEGFLQGVNRRLARKGLL